MKKTLLGSLILLAFAGNVQAADNPNPETKGKVTFYGKVVENTCKVKSGNRDMSVVLNDVGKAHLSQKGYTAMPTPFTITLEGCNANVANTGTKPKANKVGVYFYSWNNADKENSYTLKSTLTGTDKADNVNIQIFQENGTDAIEVADKTIDDFTHKNNGSANSDKPTKNHISSATALNNQTGDIALHYIAQYYATGMASAGKVQTSVDFQIAYE